MPTPSNGSISFTDIENEFKRVDGAPSSVSEYCGRPGSSAGVPYGILGVPTAGLVSFSNLRGKTAHVSASKAIAVFKASFGNTPVLITRDSGAANSGTNANYPLLHYNPAVYNASQGGAGNGNLTTEDKTPLLTLNKTGLDEDALVSEQNTVIFMQTGKGGRSGEWNYTGNGISGFLVNGVGVSVVVENDGTIIHAAGRPGAGNICNSSCRTDVAIHNQSAGKTLRDLNDAEYSVTVRDWNGNIGGSQSNTCCHGVVIVFPGKWQRISATLSGLNAGNFTLGPYEIAVVTNAQDGPTSNLVAAPYTLTQSSGSAAASITPIFFAQATQGARYTLGIYLNETASSGTYTLAQAKYTPYVQIFKFVGDGYMTSLIV